MSVRIVDIQPGNLPQPALIEQRHGLGFGVLGFWGRFKMLGFKVQHAALQSSVIAGHRSFPYASALGQECGALGRSPEPTVSRRVPEGRLPESESLA